MRFLVIGLVVATAAQAVFAEDGDKIREARSAAKAMVRPSGPVRGAASAASAYTPAEWRPARTLAGTYGDHASRHRFTRHTYGWPGWGWYTHCGWYPRAYGFYRCW